MWSPRSHPLTRGQAPEMAWTRVQERGQHCLGATGGESASGVGGSGASSFEPEVRTLSLEGEAGMQ